MKCQGVTLQWISIPSIGEQLYSWAQLFEGRLALTQGQILIWVSLFLYSKAFLGKFSMSFLKHQIVILQTKRIRLNFLLKLLDLKSDFTLTLGYLNPALNNPALVSSCFGNWDKLQLGGLLCSQTDFTFIILSRHHPFLFVIQ